MARTVWDGLALVKAADRFDPERFLAKKPTAYEWFPFGGGTRRCVGMAVAIHQDRPWLRDAGAGAFGIYRRPDLHDLRQQVENERLYEELKRLNLDLEDRIRAATSHLEEQNAQLLWQAHEVEKAIRTRLGMGDEEDDPATE